MKKNSTTIIMVLFFFVGHSILLYPAVSNLYNKKLQSNAIVDYESLLENINANDYQQMIEEAKKYNKELKTLKNPFYTHDTIEEYKDTLNVDGNGMIGYIEIKKIKVELPIYHGTSKNVLSKAVGHLEGTTLPIGGTGTHSVLSAHRGLPSSDLFTNLDKLEKGDTFTIKILDRELIYEVDNILIVEPTEIENLYIKDNEDYVTLMTCTPYGINTHRMLVRGKRIENIEKSTYITTEAFKINNLIVMPLVAIPIILIILLIVLFKPINRSNSIKEKYLYPTKIKKEFGGNKNEKK